MKRIIFAIVCLSLLLASCSVGNQKKESASDSTQYRYAPEEDSYNEGFVDGYEVGIEEGYEAGYQAALRDVEQSSADTFSNMGCWEWADLAQKHTGASFFYIGEEEYDEALMEYCRASFYLGYSVCEDGYECEYGYGYKESEMKNEFLDDVFGDYNLNEYR